MANHPSPLVFIDAAISHYSQLVAELGKKALVRVLPADKDGIAVITACVRQYPLTRHIVIVAHGTPGQIDLGNSHLGLENCDRYATQLQTWFASAPSMPQLDLYGCNVAAGDAGAEFLARLHQLTGAGIAASPRPVGHADLGGDWQLDTTIGEVLPQRLISPAFAASYRAVLPGTNNFADAQNWSPTNNTGTTAGATHETGEPIHDPNVSSLPQATQQTLNNSIWWQWTAPTTGPITVDTLGSALANTVLAVYTGGSVNSLNQIAFNDNISGSEKRSRVTFNAIAGLTYYFAVDGVGNTTGAVRLNLNTAPQITPNQSFSVLENAPAGTPLGTLTANESGLTWSIVSGNPDNDSDGNRAFTINASTGAILVNDAGDLDFEAFAPTYSLVVRATDSGGLSSQQTVAINLVDGPDAPVITNLTTSQSTITEGSQLRLSGTFNDPDAEDIHTVTINWGDGTSDVISNDNLSLPDAEGNKSFANLRHTYQDDGQYSITVTVQDAGGSVTQQVTSVAVNNVPPTITQGATLALAVNEDSPTTFTLNATDPGRQDTLTWRILNQPANGTASVSTSPTGKTQTIAYIPTANFAGNDTFEVQVQDNDGGFDTILVNVTVAPQPDPPTTLSLSGNVDALNEGESFTLTGSFADPDLGDNFTVTINWGDGSSATVLPNSRITALGNGNYTFSTSHIFQADSGAGEFSISAIVRDGSGFTVSDTLSLPVVNVPPSIEEGAFLALNTQEDEAITFTLNATDPADTAFQWSLVAAPTNGTVSFATNANGPAAQQLVYTPNDDFDQLDSFIIQVSDGHGGFNTIDVLVNVSPVNDAPESLSLTPSVTTLSEGSSLTLNGAFVDVDSNDAHTVTIAWGDGRTTILNAADLGAPSGNLYTLPSQTHTYLDEGNYTVTLTVEDADGAKASVTRAISVNNVAPVITDAGGTPLGDTLTLPAGSEDTPITLSLGAIDPGLNDALRWSVATNPANGRVTLSPAVPGQPQQFVYTPNLNFFGVDSFTVRLTDGDGGTDTLVVNLSLNPVNDLPVLTANQFTITEGQPLRITLANLNVTDVETFGPNLRFTISDLVAGERFTVSGGIDNTFTLADVIQGRVTFIDNGDAIPPAFTISVQDDNAPPGVTTVPANVNFIAVNDAPVIVNHTFDIAEGQITLLTTGQLSATDEESAASTLVYTVTRVTGGAIQVGGQPKTTFTQADIDSGRVAFAHDGSETVPTLAFTVSDGTLSTPSTAVINFTPVNDPPRLLNNTLDVAEGSIVAITLQHINATDVDNDDNTLVFTVTDPIPGGEFQLRDLGTGQFAKATEFSRLDIINNRVRFVHNGQAIEPTYTLTVRDAEGLTASGAAAVNFTPVNDAPTFTHNILTLSEGETLLLTSDNILASDEETTDPAALTYSVSNLSGGRFEFVGEPGVAIDGFTQADINTNRVRFVHDGGEREPAYTLTLSDGENSVVSEADIIFTSVNDAPLLVNNKLAITEGGIVAITLQHIDATDVDNDRNTLVFTVTDPIPGGEFQLRDLGTGQFAKATEFSRLDIINNRVRFVHNGREIEPTYTLTVRDTEGLTASGTAAVNFTPVNDAPAFTRNILTLSEGETLLLTSANILASDEETTDPAALIYTVSNLSGGRFEFVDRLGVAIDGFTQADINTNRVRFVHDGGEREPAYTLTLSDGENSVVSEADIIFTSVNDAPLLVNNKLVITEGQTRLITTADIDATDIEDNDNALIFAVGQVAGGIFTTSADFAGGEFQLKNGSGVFVKTGTFTRADIINQRVQFVHNGTETSPQYAIQVTDSQSESSSTTAAVTFTPVNDLPIVVNNRLIVSEGGVFVFNENPLDRDLVGTDEETAHPLIRYTVTALSGGQFEDVARSGVAITTFTQQQVDDRTIRFVHNGGEAAPSYTLRADDGKGGVVNSIGNVTFTNVNDAPVFTANSLTLTEGGIVVLTTANLNAVDVETQGTKLTFEIRSVVGGRFEFTNGDLIADAASGSVRTFTLEDVILERVQFVQPPADEETTPAYTVAVTDDDLVVPKTTVSNGVVNFTPINDPPTFVANSLTIAESGIALFGDGSTATAGVLSANDPETPAAQLRYTVSNVVGGRFERVAAPGAAITSFTQADIAAGTIRFVQNGTSTVPNYTVTVADPQGLTAQGTPTVNFTDVNEAPSITRNTLSITEGQTIILSSANLQYSDEESGPEAITYTFASGPVGGQFERVNNPGVAISSFTQADINAGAIQFVQNGTETTPAYTLIITDGGGVSDTTPKTATSAAEVTFTRVNDRPEITTNTLTIQEEGTVILNSVVGSPNLVATDEETPQGNLTYRVEALTHGRFELVSNPGVAITAFTQAQVDTQQVQFVHNAASGEQAPTYRLTVTDGEGSRSTVSEGTISFTRINDAPVIQVNRLTITEGTTVTLSADQLRATDEENTAESLTYTVDGGVAGGKFVRSSDPGQTAITTFTQADINAGAIQFVQDGTETVPAYTLQVTDSEGGTNTLAATVAFTPVNDPPSLQTNSLTLDEGETVVLGDDNLFTSDEESAATALTYTVQSVTNGRFELVATPGAAITSFTQAQVSVGEVQFVHSGGEDAPTYSLTVTDGAGATATIPATIDFTNINDAPVIQVNRLAITEGTTVTLSANHLLTTDAEDDPAGLTYTVTGSVAGGKFVRAGDSTQTAITTFTQADINAGAIQFVQDGTETVPAYTLQVTDSEGGTNTLAATVTFAPVNDSPILQTNSLTLQEGATVVLGNGNLLSSDEESLPAALTYTVQSVTNGRFELVASPGAAVTSFTQAQISANQVQFVHSGAEAAPTYSLTVTDGAGATATLPATIDFTNVNDAPTFLARSLRVTEAGTVVLSSANINATDPDHNPDNLLYSVANVSGGQFFRSGQPLLSTDTFTRLDIALGRITFVDDGDSTPPSFEFRATDPLGAATTVPATVQFVPVNDAPQLNVNTFSIVEGNDLVLTASNLSASDEETSSGQLLYLVSNIAGGTFINIDGDEVFSFTQAQINEGNQIVFRHNGSETPPSFTLEVVDPQGGTTGPIAAVINYTPINDAPVFTRNALTISEGQTVVLSTSHLQVSDIDTPLSQLRFTIRSLENGVFTVGGSTLGVGDSFTRNQLVLGQVSFTASNTGLKPAYTLEVSDQHPANPQTATSAATITFTPVNDAPVLQVNTFTIREGQDLELTSSNLLATDEETSDPAQLTYTVSAITGGNFFNIATGLSVTTFTQQAINERLIFFRHNGNEAPAAFTFTVRDPNGGASLPIPGNVTHIAVNDPPMLTTNAFQIEEGKALKISAAHLNTTDPDSLPTQITYTLSAITGGEFGRDANSDGVPEVLGITSFTQHEILNGQIFFIHDGNEAPPRFTIAVSDNEVSLPGVPANITFTNVNDPPSNVQISLTVSTLNEGGTVTLTGEFFDIDSTNHTVTVNWGDGTTTPVPNAQIINNGGGRFSLLPLDKTYGDDGNFVITLTVNDGQASAQQTATITVNDVPPIVPLFGSGPVQADDLYTLTIGTPVDPGNDRILSYRINWGDGTSTVVNGPGEVNKVYKVFGDYTISVTATEDNGRIFDLGTRTANILYPITDFTGDGQTDLFWRFNPGTTNIIWALKPSGEFDAGLEVRPLDSSYKVQLIDDFNNDGLSDVFWRDSSSGINGIWLLDGAEVIGSRVLPTVDLSWGIAGFADFNNDGSGDLLWRNVNSGENVIWTLADGQLQQGIVLPRLNTAFMAAAISDFNGDGNDDILWRNRSTGQNQVWLMNGTTDSGQRLDLTTADPFFSLVAASDFNGDKIEDLLWRHSVTGDNVLWVMGNQGALANGVILPQLDPAFALRGVTDLNGDNQTDLLWHNATSGETVAWAMNGTTVAGNINLPDPTPGWQVHV